MQASERTRMEVDRCASGPPAARALQSGGICTLKRHRCGALATLIVLRVSESVVALEAAGPGAIAVRVSETHGRSAAQMAILAGAPHQRSTCSR